MQHRRSMRWIWSLEILRNGVAVLFGVDFDNPLHLHRNIERQAAHANRRARPDAVLLTEDLSHQVREALPAGPNTPSACVQRERTQPGPDGGGPLRWITKERMRAA